MNQVYAQLQREAEARHLPDAERVLASLWHFNKAAQGQRPAVDILQAWSDTPQSVCVIYRVDGREQRYGLRRQFPLHFTGTPESTGDSMQMDMEEPLGAARTGKDPHGVLWHGNLTEPLPQVP